MESLFEQSTGKVAKIGQASQDAVQRLLNELRQQQALGGVKHTASWTDDQDKILQEMAEKFARLGVQSIYDIGRTVEIEEVADPSYYGDGSAPLVEQEKITIFNKRTGEQLPVGPGRWESGALTNAAGSGFTYYGVQFTEEGVPVPLATKKQTGLSALASQTRDFVTNPGVLAALAVVFGPQMYAALAPEAAAAGTASGTTGATASFAPGSLQATMAELGVTQAAGASAVPGSLQAALPSLGVTPLAAGGVNAGTASLLDAGASFPTGGASYAPGSFQEYLANEGIKPAFATPTPDSLQAYLSELGVNPLIQGGVSAGISELGSSFNLVDTLKDVGRVVDALNKPPTVQQQAGLISQGASTGGARGVDYSGLLGLLQNKAGLLPNAEQYRRGLL